MLTDWGIDRERLLVIDFLLIIALLQLGIVFIYYKVKRPENKITLFWGISFLLIASGMIARVLTTYYFENSVLDQYYYVSLAGGIFYFGWSIEHEFGHLLKTRRLLSILLGLLFILSMIVPTTYPYFFVVFSIIEYAYLLPIVFIAYIFKNNAFQIRKKMVVALIGYCFVMTGVGGTHSRFQEMLGPEMEFDYYINLLLFFKSLMFLGLALIYYAFNTDIFIETNWKGAILDLYIIHPASKECLYHRNFLENKSEIEDQSVFSGGIIGIIDVIQKFTHSKRDLEIIDEGKIKILLDQGEEIIAILVAQEDLHILRFLLRNLTVEFDNYYEGILKGQWEQNRHVFGSFDYIVERQMNHLTK